MIKEIFDEIKGLGIWAIIIIVALLIGASLGHSADSVYVLSGDALVTIDKVQTTVPAFSAELKIPAYFKCGEYDGKAIYSVPCIGNTCEALRKSAYFLGNNELEIAIKNVEAAKTFADVTYEEDAVDPKTLETVTVQKKAKYSEWIKSQPGTLKRIDKPIGWQ